MSTLLDIRKSNDLVIYDLISKRRGEPGTDVAVFDPNRRKRFLRREGRGARASEAARRPFGGLGNSPVMEMARNQRPVPGTPHGGVPRGVLGAAPGAPAPSRAPAAIQGRIERLPTAGGPSAIGPGPSRAPSGPPARAPLALPPGRTPRSAPAPVHVRSGAPIAMGGAPAAGPGRPPIGRGATPTPSIFNRPPAAAPSGGGGTPPPRGRPPGMPPPRMSPPPASPPPSGGGGAAPGGARGNPIGRGAAPTPSIFTRPSGGGGGGAPGGGAPGGGGWRSRMRMPKGGAGRVGLGLGALGTLGAAGGGGLFLRSRAGKKAATLAAARRRRNLMIGGGVGGGALLAGGGLLGSRD
jgi:translation initiation factor IF-2